MEKNHDNTMESILLEYEKLKEEANKLLERMAPEKIVANQRYLDRSEEQLGCSLNNRREELEQMADDLRNRMIQIRCLLSSVLEQIPTPDTETFMKNVNCDYDQLAGEVIVREGVVDAMKTLKDSLIHALNGLKTIGECFSIAEEQARSDSDVVFSQCPQGYAQKGYAEGADIYLLPENGVHPVRQFFCEADIEKYCIATGKMDAETQYAGEYKVLAIKNAKMMRGIMVRAGYHLVILCRVQNEDIRGGWMQTTGPCVACAHSTVQRKR